MQTLMIALTLSAIVSLLSVAPQAQERRAASELTRAEQEAFLTQASIVGGEAAPGGRESWRVTLDDGTRQHAASVVTADGSDAFQRHHTFHIAAYELDKALDLGFVPPAVARLVGGRPAAVTWWVDGAALNELERRRKNIAPPDPDRWNAQLQVVRVFDELIANAYRRPDPALYTSTIWDNLLITREWQIWITDHTRAFGRSRELESPWSLTRCDRALLGKLRELTHDALTQRLGPFLDRAQLDALDARRALLVQHFDERVARLGEAAVLYDRAPR